MYRLAALPVVLILFTACPAEPPDPEDITDELSRQSGCADLVLFAANTDDTLAIHFEIDGIVGDTPADPSETTYEFTFPSTEVSLIAERGEYLTEITCGDVLMHEIVVDDTFEAISGTATLTVRPNTTVDDSPRVDLDLTDLVFEDQGGVQLTVDTLTWSNVAVGWFPG